MPITFANNAFLKFNGSKSPELLKKRGNIGINTNVLHTNRFISNFICIQLDKKIDWLANTQNLFKPQIPHIPFVDILCALQHLHEIMKF